MNIYKGISASSGIGIGNAYFLENKKTISIPQVKIQSNEKSQGWQRFENSLSIIKSRVEEKSASCDDPEILELTQTYLLMLNDTVFIDEIKNEYNVNFYNIEYTIHKVLETYADKLRSIDDDYFRERAIDVTDIFTKVIYHMMGFTERDFSTISDNSIIIANNIQPSEAIEILKKNISGIIINEGGINSHLSILARSHNIPLVFGIDVLHVLKNHRISKNSVFIVDGNSGEVIFNALESQITEFKTKQLEEQEKKTQLMKYINTPAITKDGDKFTLLANIGSSEEVEFVLSNGAEGIGLLRTEFLFMEASDSNELLTEETQYKIYSDILKKMGDKTVVIRTLDAGGDKVLQSPSLEVETEANPLLGNRAIRFCLSRKDIFISQLRAIFRAAVFGNLKIMIPLISTVSQFEETLEVIDGVKKQLLKENIPCKIDIPLGIMIETPSAAICADKLATMCDFFSIGTNDLTQYTLAVDRENLSVSNLFDDLNPAVLNLIKHTYLCAEKAGISVSVCGELAGNLKGAQVLGGIGIRQLSMTSTKICATKAMLAETTIEQMKNISLEALKF